MIKLALISQKFQTENNDEADSVANLIITAEEKPLKTSEIHPTQTVTKDKEEINSNSWS